MTLRFCPKCGGKLSPDGLFCTVCGADLRERMKDSEAPIPKEKAPVKKNTLSEKLNVKNEPSTTMVIPKETTTSLSKITYAVLYQRMLAWFIDITILILCALAITRQISFLFLIVLFFIGILYFWILESFNKGQSIGKIFLKLRTVDEKTLKPAKKSKYIINNLTKATVILPFDIIIGILKNRHEPGNRVRFTQNLSNTVVIKLLY